MASEFTLPFLGDSIKSGTVVKVLVSTGDTIEEDQAVLDLETDKAVSEVYSTLAGTVGEILVQPGQKLNVGDPVFKVEDGNAAAPAAATPAASENKESTPPSPTTDQKGMGTATDTGPATSGSANGASSNGTAPATTAPRGDDPKHTAPAIENKGANGSAPASGSGGSGNVLVAAAPSVRRLARELGVDIQQVQGTGARGRISYADVKNFLQQNVSAPSGAVSGAPGVAIPPLPDFTQWGEVERQTLSGIRMATARHMARCWAEVPHVTQFDKADITDLEALRKKFGPVVEKAGAKLTPTAIALKVLAAALKKFPQFNASLDLRNEEIVLKKYVHIGVAVDTPRGLVVPVIRDVDKKSIIEIAIELNAIGEKARAGKTSLADMQGGTFTLTNLGGIGGTGFTPIVNAPEVAILGVARGGYEPFWNGKEFEPRMMMPLCLSYDHRAIDGADGARFLRWVASALEQPFLMSLEG